MTKTLSTSWNIHIGFSSAMVAIMMSLALLFAPPVKADEESVWLTTGEWSRHDHNQSCSADGSDCHDKYRQNNTGVGLQIDFDRDVSSVLGWYNNSLRNESVYLGMTYAPIHVGGAKLGVMSAVATGYYYVPVPIASIYASYEYERYGVNVFWLPDVVVAIQLKVKIK